MMWPALRQTWRGWVAYKDPDINSKAWAIEATADFIAMGAGLRLGGFAGPPGALIGGYFAPDIIKRGALFVSEPFMNLSSRPLEFEATVRQDALMGYEQMKNSNAAANPISAPTFVSQALFRDRCPPGYHLVDGACVRDD